jgi:hypothetical protein
MMLNCGFAFAQDTNRASANSKMPGCRSHIAMIDNKPYNRALIFDQDYCMGTIHGVLYALTNMCVPPGVNQTQLIRVVVKYIDDQPARLNEDFDGLAVEALQAAWACKK